MTSGGGRHVRGGRGGFASRVGLAASGVLLLVFVAGIAVGWGVARRMHTPRRRPQGPPSPFGMLGGGNLVARLKLTPAESIAFDSAFKKRLPQAEAFWRGPGREWRDILDSTRADVRAALPTDKRAMFDSLTHRGRRESGAPGGAGSGAPAAR